MYMKKLNQIALIAFVALALTACQSPISSDPAPDPVSYTVTFDADMGAAVKAITADGNTTVTLPVTTRKGYTFNGWDINSDGTAECTATAPTITLTSDVTAKALWKINSYTITFNVEYHGRFLPEASMTKAYKAWFRLPSPKDNPDDGVDTKFYGWSTHKSATNPEYADGGFFLMPDYDVTLYVVAQ